MTRKLMLLALVFTLATGAATAGGYLGGGVGQTYSSTQNDLTNLDLDDSTTGWKVFGGWTFLKFFALEASYVEFGSIEGESSGAKVETEATAYDAFAVGKIPITFIEPFVKIGYANVDSKATLSGSGSASDQIWDLAYGVGVGFNFTKLHVRVEYELYDISPNYDGVEPESDLSMVSASAAWRF